MKWIAAVALATVLAAGFGAGRGWIIVPGHCASLTPDNWFLWWYYSCDKDAAGGGGGGAG